MATHTEIDEKLLQEAMALGSFRTRKAAVNAALEEYVRARKQRGILDLVGQVDFDPDYDYKALRSR